MNSIDIFVQNFFLLHRTQLFTDVMYLLSLLFNFSSYFLLILFLVGIIVFFVKGWRSFFLFTISLFFGGVIVYLLKLLFNSPRPTDAVIYAFGQSFPSYHATISTIFFIILVYIFRFSFKGYKRKIFDVSCYLFILLISFSRVYLGVHWFSDVFFGIILGLIISRISIVIYKKVINNHGAEYVLK